MSFNQPRGAILMGGLCALLMGAVTCEHQAAEPAPEPAATATQASAATAAPAAATPAATMEPATGKLEPMRPSNVPFTGGEKSFQVVKDLLRTQYYRAGLSEDDLYKAAVAGMLQQLEPQMGAWNKLLTPEEMNELHADMKGEMVGIGVEIRFDEESGISDVLSVIPGSPAEHGGIRAGDKILTVAGKFYKGKTLRDVVFDLRGQAGEQVKLTTLRGADVLTFQIRREHVVYDFVKTMLLPGDVGYVFIRQFADNTPASVQSALQELAAKSVRAIVIDLRGNQGGLFDKAVATAELFLKKGTPIVKVRNRGGEETRIVSNQSGATPSLPLALLVDGETASSGELLAGALREGIGAQIIGQKTFGKGSIQRLEELPNHYGVKYTASAFFLPSGAAVEGQGLAPDVDVALPVTAQSSADRERTRVQHIMNVTERLQADVQLRAAVNILHLRLR